MKNRKREGAGRRRKIHFSDEQMSGTGFSLRAKFFGVVFKRDTAF